MSKENRILKSIYQDYFMMGAACEKINERFKNHEIGNPEKEALLQKHFNSITFANELKPAYNMGYSSPLATEEYLPFVINSQAKEMLDFAKNNQLKVRAHVLVWHSQCPKEIFCKNYTPVTYPTDPELLKEKPFLKFMEKLNPVCYVDRNTLLKRMESYIHSTMEYMYKNGYGDVIYTWDVVNEAIELADQTASGLRNSYWYQIIGDDFVYYAFRYTKDAVDKYSSMYASLYGISADDSDAIRSIQPVLIYNDYNEFLPDKKAAILSMLNASTEEHGSILSEKLIGGIGMQGHLSDNNDISEYIAALQEYASLVPEVHITELDVKCTCTNQNREYYQAVFYKEFFQQLINCKKAGFNLSSVTFWGLTDDNSWIRNADPLLFRGDLSEKKSFDGVVYAVTGGDLGKPEAIWMDLSNRYYTFSTKENEEEPINLNDIGFKMRGFGEITLQSNEVHSGKFALQHGPRFDNWSGISFDASDFIGQTISLSAFVKSQGVSVSLNADHNGKIETIATVETAGKDWVELQGTYTAPRDIHALTLFFNVKEESEETYHNLYVDDVSLSLIGMKESFEGETHIAGVRGAGHLPLLQITDKDSLDGKSHSLLVTRQEKDATVKFDISSFLGYTIQVSAYVKTMDTMLHMGLDGATPKPLTSLSVLPNTWTQITATLTLPKDLPGAEIYLETNGNSDLYVDDIFVTLA